MKIASKTLLAAVLLFGLIASPLRAQDAPDADTNNTPASKPKNQPRDDNAPVRIDHTGVHIGGDNPVDIGLPDTGGRGDGGIMGGLVMLLPIISVLAVFGMPVAIVGLVLYFHHRRHRMRHETLRAMVEKGVPIPAELLSERGATLAAGSNVERRGNRDLRAGLVLIAVGGGLFLIAGRAGYIPLFIGVALILAWLIGNKSKNSPTPQ